MKIKFAAIAVIAVIVIFGAFLAPLYPQTQSQSHATLAFAVQENNGFHQYRDIAIGGSGSFNVKLPALPVTAGIQFEGYFPRYANQELRSENNYEFYFSLPIKYLVYQAHSAEGLFIVAAPMLQYQDVSEWGSDNHVNYGGSIDVEYQRSINQKVSFLFKVGMKGYDSVGTFRTGLNLSAGVVLN